MAEALDRLMTWVDAIFSFRVGITVSGRSVPESASDYVLPDGVDARHILLEAAVLGDNLMREPGCADAPAMTPEVEARLDGVFSAIDVVSPLRPDELSDAEASRVAKHFLHYSEQLLSSTKQREMSLAVLGYAREIFKHGAVVLCSRAEYRVVDAFGSPFAAEGLGEREAPPPMLPGRSALFDAIVADRSSYAGLVRLEPSGPSPIAPSSSDGAAVLAIPITVVGRVLMIVFCRGALAGGPDARSLVVLAKHASVAVENCALRTLLHKAGPAS
jgi:hypothetical protein